MIASGTCDCAPVIAHQGRRHISLLSPQWLVETNQEEDFTNGLDRRHIFKGIGPIDYVWQNRVPGPQLVDHPTQAGKQVLHLRKPDEHSADGAMWNFPLGQQGVLILRFMLKDGFQGCQISLLDRMLNPHDDRGESMAIFGLAVKPKGTLNSKTSLIADRWYTLAFRWDLSRSHCDLLLDGESVGTLELQNETVNGICYLRLRSAAQDLDPAGFLVEHVAVHITDANTPSGTR